MRAQGQAHEEWRQGAPHQVLVTHEPVESFAAGLLPLLQRQRPRERGESEEPVPAPRPAPELEHRYREEGEVQSQPLPEPGGAGDEQGPHLRERRHQFRRERPASPARVLPGTSHSALGSSAAGRGAGAVQSWRWTFRQSG